MDNAGSVRRAVFCVGILCSGLAVARSVSPGDVAIIGFNCDNPDEFGFVALVDFEPGSEIYFTDSGLTADGIFRGGEGAVKYTVPSQGLTSGSVVVFTGENVDFVSANDSNVGTGGLALSSSGDQIIVFQGSSSAPDFIYALNVEGTGWQSDATNSNETALPPGLTDGSSALALNEADNGYYSGSVAGTRAELLEAISDGVNWTTSNTRMGRNNWVPEFTVFSASSGRTSVQFASTGDTVSEGTSSYDIAVTIAGEDSSNETTADVVLTSDGTATNGRDIWWYTTQTVTFPAGDSSSQSVTILLLEDSEFEGAESLGFELQDVAGGHEAAAGSPSRFTLTIQDNDPPALVINEIHYNPAVDQGPDGEYEFLELYNRSTYTAYLSGYRFSDGIELAFGPSDSLEPDAYLVVAKRGTTYPGSIEWTSGNLTNSGEAVVLVIGQGTVVDSVMYAGSGPWPAQANGRGPSLELLDPLLDNSGAEAWQASFVDGGTPGTPNSSNSVPQAMADSFSIHEDEELVVDPPGVLENDSDADGHPLTPFVVAAPVNGEMALSSDGGLEYFPDPDFFGRDTLVYAVHDGTDTSSSALCFLKVLPVNDPPDPFDLLWPEDSSVVIITEDLLGQTFAISWESSHDRDGDNITYELRASGDLSFLSNGGIVENTFSVAYQEMVSGMNDSDRVEGDWTVVASDGLASREADNGPFHLTLDASSLAVLGGVTIPTAFWLHANVPNPFNPFTRIRYDVPTVSDVRIEIYDLLGRRIETLVSGVHAPGTHNVFFPGKTAPGLPLASGIYICRMVASDAGTDEVIFHTTRKLAVIK